LERFEAVEPHMGSMVRIVAYAKDKAAARAAFQQAFARVAELDGILSDYKPESELNRLCAARSAIVSRDLFRVLEASQRLAAESEGAFDITAAPLIRLWREARKSKTLPSSAPLQDGAS
jgi:thiamine biosynthesis lipoprotein